MSRMLIVDDKEENLYYLHALLTAHGHEVDTARHGAEALVKARQSPPDLVVSDLLMPVMDGYTLLRLWKADPRLCDIKFVVYTATYTEAEDERLALSLGADAFILKPSEPEHFLSRIAEVQAKASSTASATPPEDGDQDSLMQSYSETLIRKLEEKTLQLQESNSALLLDIAMREQSEARLHLVTSAVLQSAEAILITDAQLDAPGPHIIFANPAFTRLTGYGLEEVIGQTPRILQGPRTDPAVLRRLRAQLERGERFAGATVNYRKDGSEYDQEWEIGPIVDSQGRATHYVAVQRDVTERNRIAQELHDSSRERVEMAARLEQEQLRLIAAQRVAKVGSWEHELATGRLIWSDETHHIHGTQPSDFEPTRAGFLGLVHPDDRARVDAAYDSSIERGDGVTEHRLLLPDGRIKYVEERWQFEVDQHQSPLRAIGTCQDISARKQAESELVNTRDRLLLATQAAQIGIWEWDVVGNDLMCDAQMLALYGLGEGGFGGGVEAWAQFVHPHDRERFLAEASDAVAGIREYNTRFRIIQRDGMVCDIEANGLVQRAADGTALRMIGTNRDISEQMEADRRIRYLNRVHAMMSSVNALIVRAGTRDNLFQQACRIAVEVGGFQLAMLGVVVPEGLDFVAVEGSSEEAVGLIRQFMSTRGSKPSTMAARAMRERVPRVSNATQSDPQVEHRDMHLRFGNHSLAILPVLAGADPLGVMALYAAEADFFHAEEIALLTELAADIALAVDHLEKSEQLAFLAHYDPLTGLGNRNLFLDRVGEYARSAARNHTQLAVVIFDLERFKNINYSLGRPAGDDLLKQVAAWLAGRLGDANQLSRINADHFGIVLPAGAASGDTAHAIEGMLADFGYHSFEVNGETLRLAAHAGIAVSPADGEVAEELFKRAEAALKEAKADGARYLFYSQKMTDAIAGRLALESQLRSALENDEFVLHYQPKVDLRSGLLTGAEALIRWNNPRTGMMLPGLFIPILEQTGLINEVGRWAVQQAITDRLRWCQRGLPAVPIAVNVSQLQLRDPTFISQLRRAIAVAPGVAQGLELEITESMIMHDVDQSIASLKTIREMGISVSIDDFGTGFSSLGYLAKLPIDTLKIDRMFIVDMGASDDGLSLISTMMTLARALKLKVVAEGVETPEQARMLGLLKCDEIQGFLISPAVSCEEFEARFLATAWRMARPAGAGGRGDAGGGDRS